MAQQLGLSRSTLLSLITICATLAIFATGATFALTTSDSASGSVTAGTFIAIDVRGTGAASALAFSFAPSSATCPSALLPGDSCRAQVTVENTGFVPLTLDAPTTSPDGFAAVNDSAAPPGCTGASWPVTLGALDGSELAPHATRTFVVTVTLAVDAPLACQNETAVVTVSVNANTLP